MRSQQGRTAVRPSYGHVVSGLLLKARARGRTGHVIILIMLKNMSVVRRKSIEL